MAATTGALVTAVIHSSSVTTVLVVGFVSAGLMSMTQSIGIIMGANIGTTVTAHIVAFKVTEYALLLIAVGFALLFFGKTEKARLHGNLLMGLGLIFFGMGIMSEGMAPLRSYQPFIDLMVAMENPLPGILVAAIFTALVQSSSATTGIVIVMATQGFITLPAGIAMALGANIGTCVTALLAAIGKSTEAVRRGTHARGPPWPGRQGAQVQRRCGAVCLPPPVLSGMCVVREWYSTHTLPLMVTAEYAVVQGATAAASPSDT
jgi:phosphate:Na+ symporter